jgi:omega-3 fatty acid desaturase (delta-15 desaturase)
MSDTGRPSQCNATLSLKNIRESIPKECFQKKPLLGAAYIIADIGVICGCCVAFSLSPQTVLYKLMYWFCSGFFMWCLFVDGHDCGHGSFSDSFLLNTFVGHLSHTPLLVPYATWAYSHHLHHLHHNHVKKDYSHVWIPTHYADKKPPLVRALQASCLAPILGWFLYLAGVVDGGHWAPFGGRLWSNHHTWGQFAHSCLSSALVFGFFTGLLQQCRFDLQTLVTWYGGSWFVFAFWLVTVTYMQHHDDQVEDTVIYGDESWTFLKGALQTVDRSYGSIIDRLSHHITNGHLVHHLFFTKIPHYHLEKATTHLYAHLEQHGITYKHRVTYDFYVRIFALTSRHLNEATLVK